MRVNAEDFARILREVPASSDSSVFEKNVSQGHRQSLSAALDAHETRACPHVRFLTSVLCSYCGLSAASRRLRIFAPPISKFPEDWPCPEVGAPEANNASPTVISRITLQLTSQPPSTSPALPALSRTPLAAMFAKLSITFTFASLALLAVATPNGKRWNTPTSAPTAPTKTVTVTAPASAPTEGSCSTGPVQCCASTESASSPSGAALLGLLGVVVQGVDVLLGLGCSPISVIGVGGGECKANVVCCQNNAVGGLISIGCVPVIL